MAQSQSEGGSSNSLVVIEGGPGKTHADIRYSGTQRVITEQDGTVTNKFAPAVAAPAMGSGHPCGLGNSLGVSIIGGGVTGGATRVDDACLLAQMGYGPAAMQMIAARNSSACKALVASGNLSAKSYCGDEARQEIVRGPGVYKPAAVRPARGFNVDPARAAEANPANLAARTQPVTTTTNGITCRIKPGTTRTIITDATTPQQRAACVASLGLRG